MLRPLFFILFLTLTPFAAQAAPQKLKVVATFSILGDIVSHIGGDNIQLTTLVGPGADAHSFEPTPDTVKAVSDADLVIANGLGFEGWMGRLIVSSGYSGQVIIAAKDITPITTEEKLEMDPHAWQSVTNVIQYVANIRDALINADPAHSAKYKENTANYTRELNQLENWVQDQIASVPEDQRAVITTHDAFRYFGRYYGVRFLAPSGIVNEASPSAGSIARILDEMRREKISALFLEDISDNKVIKQLQQDGGAIIGGTLYSDALSPASGPAPTYIDMMHHNVSALVSAMKKNGTASSPSAATPEASPAPIQAILPQDQQLNQ